MKVEKFKQFVRNNSYLINYVKNNKMTWQKFYEIYDLYGEDDSIWDEFRNNSATTNNITNTIKSFMNLFKGIDLNNIQKALTSLDKAIEALKNINDDNNHEYTERPKNKYYED